MKWMTKTTAALVLLTSLAALPAPSRAQEKVQDKVSVGVFPVSSSLPYFVALERGFFKEENIEPEMTKLMGGPPNVAAMMTNQIEVSAVLVTLEGLNANVKKPGVAMYIALNSQTKSGRWSNSWSATALRRKPSPISKAPNFFRRPGPPLSTPP